MLVTNRIHSAGWSSARRMAGASLVEVLVSILLAAVGLLALSGANVVSIRYSKMSQYRGTATMLAADLAERMRANQGGLASYAVSSTFVGQATPLTASTACETYSANCNPAAMAAYDLVNWRIAVRNQLPEGSVFIIPSTVVLAADVWVAWRDPAVANDAENNTDSRNAAKECPTDANFTTDKSIRCSYFRINI